MARENVRVGMGRASLGAGGRKDVKGGAATQGLPTVTAVEGADLSVARLGAATNLWQQHEQDRQVQQDGNVSGRKHQGHRERGTA